MALRPIKPQYILDELADICESLRRLERADLSQLRDVPEMRRNAVWALGNMDDTVAKLRTKIV